MTTAKILQMLADNDSDNDELNARIYCFLLDYVFEKMEDHMFAYSHSKLTKCLVHNHGGTALDNISDYTTSLDAAMSIGAEELEKWAINILTFEDRFEARIHLPERIAEDGNNWIYVSGCLSTMPRAIAHARIQAVEYMRGL